MRGRILVVDDDPTMLEFVRLGLLEDAYEVVMATNAEEALEHLRIAPDSYSVVISDIVMPGMNGLALVQRIHDLNADLCVLLMSAYNLFDLPDNCKFLLKPFGVEALLAEVNNCLDTHLISKQRSRSSCTNGK